MPRVGKNAVLPPDHKMRLDTVRGVLAELGRLYRAAMNGKIGADEATRYAYLLKEIRSAIESEQAQLELVPEARPAILCEIISVPHNHQIRGDRIWPNVPKEAEPLIEQIELLLAAAAATLPAKVVAVKSSPQSPAGGPVVSFPGARRVEEEVEEVEPVGAA